MLYEFFKLLIKGREFYNGGIRVRQEMQESAYSPKEVEKKWYAFWEKKGFFTADVHSEKPSYSLVMPPPNVTGNLHMGHALVNTLQDIIVRWKRMDGFEVLWVPGTDHAGIATQSVVERKLFAETGKRRFEFSREEFLEHVWAYKEQYGTAILEQIRRLGCSCDWSRLRFTLDDSASRAVRAMFAKMFNDGLIYQGDYLVNWDPVLGTALADDEVEYEDRETSMWHLRYPLADGTGFVVIATTRPEVMLADTAVAVHPEDERYKHLIGKEILLPITNRKIPLIGDPMVDPAFGSGVVKITPGHDPNDYELAKRHNLPMINLLTKEGRFNENGGRFAGLTVEEARVAVVQEMEKLGHFVKKDKHLHRVGRSYRSKAIIEPMLSKQWFIRMDHFKDRLKKIVDNGETRLLPPHWGPTYHHWIDNLRDWCISRQLWWGHRIPVWHNKKDPTKKIVIVDEIPEAISKNPEEWEQDPDVLDTWFSAGLWPFSTLGWPEKTPELERFYPNSTLVTAHDILFFWVARMLLMGDYALGKPPFPETYIHGLIFGKSYWRTSKDGMIAYCSKEERDSYDSGKPVPKDVQSKWEKMSKTKGNIIDPIEIIDSFGADATRLALASCPTSQRQIDIDRRRLEDYKHFANKFWNGARFVLMNLEGEKIEGPLHPDLLLLEDKWILIRLKKVIQEVNEALAGYGFDKAVSSVYRFFWDEFCAYYLEIAKPVLRDIQNPRRKEKQKLLFLVLEQVVRLLHPFTPFITEELYQVLKGFSDELASPSCAIAPYPKDLPLPFEEGNTLAMFSKLQNTVVQIRNVRAEMKIPPGEVSPLFLIGNERDLAPLMAHQALLKALVKVGEITPLADIPNLPLYSSAFVEDVQLIVPLPPHRLDAEKTRLSKELEKTDGEISRLEAQLGNSDFLERAPKDLVDKLRNQLNEATERKRMASVTLNTLS
jgi:valyl-tRNA synthetase